MVIFDCDGVLVDSEPISNAVLAGMLGLEGLHMSVAQARSRYQGLMLEQVRSSAEGELGRPLGDGWIERYERERTEAFRAGLRAVSGARECVKSLTGAGLKVCVASQGKLAKTALSLELTGLDDLFEPSWLFSADSVARGKPHPDLFLHAAASMGVPAASCVVVEDTPSGVRAAVAAGMPVFGYCADSDEAALESAGARVIRDLAEVPAAPELS